VGWLSCGGAIVTGCVYGSWYVCTPRAKDTCDTGEMIGAYSNSSSSCPRRRRRRSSGVATISVS